MSQAQISPAIDKSSAPSQRSAGNRSAGNIYDWSLRVLMGVIVTGLAACIIFLVWRWARPIAQTHERVPLSTVQLPAKAKSMTPEPQSEEAAQVLLQPGQVYRCERRGRVTYSDRPCADGSSRAAAPAPSRSRDL